MTQFQLGHVAHFGAALCCLFATIIAATPAPAQSEEFTFKRVQPPSADTDRRIDIQVERTWPFREPAATVAATPADPDRPSVPSEPMSDWFWSGVGTSLVAASPERGRSALETINRAAEGAALRPNTELLNKIVATHGPSILLGTSGKKVSPALVLAMIAVESAGDQIAVSPKGATGLMQLMPATAERFGVADPNDPVQNIAGGSAYMDYLLELFKGDPVLALAAYNAGENAIISRGRVPEFKETRNYVPKVLAAWDRARLYCQTVPRFIDDGCVIAFDRSIAP